MIRHSFPALFITLVLALTGPLSGPALAQNPTILTLADAQQMAVRNFETVRLAKDDIQQAQLLKRQALSAVLPNVNVNGTYTRNLVSAEFEFGGNRISVLPANDYNFGLTFSQPIYAGLRELKALRQTNVNIEAAGVGVGQSVQNTVLGVTGAYYLVLGSQEYVAISQRAVDVAQATLRTAESLFRAGESVETAVLRARVAVGNAQRQLIDAQNTLSLAWDQLRLFLGTVQEFELTRPQPPTPPSESVDALVDAAMQARPELRILDLQRRIAELEVEKRRGAYFPVVKADGSVTQRRASFPSSRLGSIAINATWNVFNGGRTGAEVGAAEVTLRQTELQRELLRKQTTNEVRAAYLKIGTARANVDVLTQQVDVARRNADETGRAYKVGEATDLDILTANEQVSRSERDLLQATFSYELAMYELQRAVGTLAPDLVAAAAPGGQH
jgi:TolC family type I secretion outer membrane protein